MVNLLYNLTDGVSRIHESNGIVYVSIYKFSSPDFNQTNGVEPCLFEDHGTCWC